MPALYGLNADAPVYRVADRSEMFDLLIAKLREETEELAGVEGLALMRRR